MNSWSTLLSRLGRTLLLTVVIIALAWAPPAAAQNQPPEPPDGGAPQAAAARMPGAELDPETGLYVVQDAASAPSLELMLDAGGPDNFGYTFRDTEDGEPAVWYDASGGTVLPYNGYQAYNTIGLPFMFKYYENSYSTVFVSKYGYLTFDETSSSYTQNYVPIEDDINNVIAGFWSPLYLHTDSNIFTQTFGSAPNRYVVFEWSQMRGNMPGDPIGFNDIYTFEIVLHENGDIAINYHSMVVADNNYYFGGSGIEDSRGIDGFEYEGNFHATPNTVRFTRPAASGRVLVYPNSFGVMGAAGEVASFAIPIKNTGELGSDTFELTHSCAWPVSFRDQDTKNPLGDTNSSGQPDTGLMAQNATKTMLVDMQFPVTANVGTNHACQLTVTPAKAAFKARTVTLQAAVAAPFTSIYRDNSYGYTHLTVNEPAGQKKYSMFVEAYGFSTAVAEAPNGDIVSVWGQSRYPTGTTAFYVEEITYSILNKNGGVVKAPTLLADLSGLGVYVYDSNPSVAVGPDGSIAIAFSRSIRPSYDLPEYSNNTFLAILDGAGNLKGLYNLTGNGPIRSGTPGYVWIYSPGVAATADNRFQLVWQQQTQTSNGYQYDLYFAAYSTGGAVVLSPLQIGPDTPATRDRYYQPRITPVNGNQVFISYYGRHDAPRSDIHYQVRRSNGDLVIGQSVLNELENYYYGYNPDAVQLSTGNILVAWEANGWIKYRLLNASYAPLGTVQSLPQMSSDDSNLSVTADQGGHGILNWTNSTGTQIFYSLIDTAGTWVTPPMMQLYSSNAIRLGYNGQNITSRTIQPTAGQGTDLALSAPAFIMMAPGADRSLQVELSNLGPQTATTITVNLSNPALLPLGAVTPPAVCDADSCTWTLPSANLAFMGSSVLTIPIQMPDVALGTAYTLAFSVSSPQTDAHPNNNTLNITVMSGKPYLLPMIKR